MRPEWLAACQKENDIADEEDYQYSLRDIDIQVLCLHLIG